MTLTSLVTSTVHCDTEGCSATLVVNAEITEDQAARAVEAVGWQVQFGQCYSHHCVAHRAVAA